MSFVRFNFIKHTYTRVILSQIMAFRESSSAKIIWTNLLRRTHVYIALCKTKKKVHIIFFTSAHIRYVYIPIFLVYLWRFVTDSYIVLDFGFLVFCARKKFNVTLTAKSLAKIPSKDVNRFISRLIQYIM